MDYPALLRHAWQTPGLLLSLLFLPLPCNGKGLPVLSGELGRDPRSRRSHPGDFSHAAPSLAPRRAESSRLGCHPARLALQTGQRSGHPRPRRLRGFKGTSHSRAAAITGPQSPSQPGTHLLFRPACPAPRAAFSEKGRSRRESRQGNSGRAFPRRAGVAKRGAGGGG